MSAAVSMSGLAANPSTRTTKRSTSIAVARGLVPGPAGSGPPPIAGAVGDSSVAVDCGDFGTYALYVVFAASMSGAADWAVHIADDMMAMTCP